MPPWCPAGLAAGNRHLGLRQTQCFDYSWGLTRTTALDQRRRARAEVEAGLAPADDMPLPAGPGPPHPCGVPSTPTLASFALAATALILLPGPAMLFLVSRG